VQVVRCFENPDVHHVSATIDPIRDIEVINTELVLADLASLQERRDRLTEATARRRQDSKDRKCIIEDSSRTSTSESRPSRGVDSGRKSNRASFFLLTSKPTIFACNVAESIWRQFPRRFVESHNATCHLVEVMPDIISPPKPS